MHVQSKLLYARPVLRFSLTNYENTIPECDISTCIRNTNDYQFCHAEQRDQYIYHDGPLPNCRKSMRTIYGMTDLRDDVLLELLFFMSRIVIKDRQGVYATPLKSGQFVLGYDRAMSILSPEFITILKNGWDNKMASHQCFRDDPSLCMASLWDKFDTIKHPLPQQPSSQQRLDDR